MPDRTVSLYMQAIDLSSITNLIDIASHSNRRQATSETTSLWKFRTFVFDANVGTTSSLRRDNVGHYEAVHLTMRRNKTSTKLPYGLKIERPFDVT